MPPLEWLQVNIRPGVQGVAAQRAAREWRE